MLMQSFVVDLPIIRGAFVSLIQTALPNSEGDVLSLTIVHFRLDHTLRFVLPLNEGIMILLGTPFRPVVSQEEC